MSDTHPDTELILYLYDELPAEDRDRIARHLETCPACAAELAELGQVRAAAASLPRPDLAASRWTAMIRGAVTRRVASGQVRRSWLGSAARQGLAAAVLISMGALGAGLLGVTRSSELTRLEARLRETQIAAALSLVRDGASSERLRGVGFGSQVLSMDAGVSAALIRALTRDPSANVRMAVLDAIGNAPQLASVDTAVLAALPGEPLPPVRMAMIDLLARRNQPGTREGLARLAESDGDATVRARAGAAAARLDGVRDAR